MVGSKRFYVSTKGQNQTILGLKYLIQYQLWLCVLCQNQTILGLKCLYWMTWVSQLVKPKSDYFRIEIVISVNKKFHISFAKIRLF